MEVLFDAYSWRARVFPVYLTVAPVALALAAVAPEGLKVPLGGAAALVFVPLSFFAAQVGADFGKRLEKRLWTGWGGASTTRFLRHGNDEFNGVTRGRVHEKLRSLGLHVPTLEDQRRDPRASDDHYESCTEELIRRTRDSSKFPLVFKALVEYGFRRNLLGLRRIGLALATTALAVCLWALAQRADGRVSTPAVAAALLTAALLLMWLAWVNDDTVRISASRYARFLLEAALDLE